MAAGAAKVAVVAERKDFKMKKNYEKNDLEITHIFRYNFPIPKIYEFHTRESANVEVIVIRAFL